MGSCSNPTALFPDPLTSFIATLIDELETFAKTAKTELQSLDSGVKTAWQKYVDLIKQPPNPNETQEEQNARTQVSSEATLLLLKSYHNKIKAVRDRVTARTNEINVDLLAEQLVRMLPGTKGMPKEFVEGFGVGHARGFIERYLGRLRAVVKTAENALQYCGLLIQGVERIGRGQES